jgi:hypothetical protein
MIHTEAQNTQMDGSWMYSVWSTSTQCCCGVTFHESLLFISLYRVRNLSALVDGKGLETSASLFTIGVSMCTTARYIKA